MIDDLCPQCIDKIKENEVLCVKCNISYHKSCTETCILCGGSAVEKNALVVKGNTLPVDTLDAVVQAYNNNFLSPLETAAKVVGDTAPVGLAKIHVDYIKEYNKIEANAAQSISKYKGLPGGFMCATGITGFFGGSVGGFLVCITGLDYFGIVLHPETLITFVGVLFCTTFTIFSAYNGAKYGGKLGWKIGEYLSYFRWPHQDAEKKAIEAKKEEELQQLKEKYQRLLTEK